MTEPVGLARVVSRLVAPVAARAARGEVVAPALAHAPVVAALADGGPLVVAVTATTSEADRLADDLASLLARPGAVERWPGWDTHPLERVSPDLAVMGQRHRLRWLLRRGDAAARVVVAPVRALTQVLAPGEPPEPVVLARGDVVDRDDLVRRLAALGYRREPIVEHRGEFAVRGGIVDVWSTEADEPVRADLFGDEVERLGVFDIADQRSVREVAAVRIFSAREWLPDESARAEAGRRAADSAWGREGFDRIAAGAIFDGMEGWMTLLADQRRTLLDELAPDARLVVIEPGRVRERLAALLEEERELVETVAATWGVEGGVPLLHRDLDEALGPRSVDVAVAGLGSPGATPLEATSPPVVQGDPERLAAHVRAWPRNRRGVVAATSEASAHHIAEMLRAEGVTVSTDPAAALEVTLTVLHAPLAQGFALESEGLVVWAESDITGRRASHRAPRARAGRTEGFFDGLAVGSYVVHRQYGVARFSGSTSRAINGTVRDYLVLEFRDGRSYWPLEQIDALTPYTGGDAPALSRMGSEQWQKTRAKASAAAFLVAEELVELYRARHVATGFAFSPDTPWQLEMEAAFPFTETADQLRAIAEVKADMEQPRPMDRLLCADVGFGKTEVAMRAIFKAVQDNKQAAILVPTTLLASQHHATMTERFAGYPVNIALLSRFVEDAEAARVVAGLADGSVDVVVGTHRLLDERVEFKQLGLLVVDEEQRFGVAHKEAIKRRAVGVDVLTLTASPIPRTLEMAFTGIRDLSMMTTPPAERRPILTHVGEYDEAAVVEAVRRELLREGQVFYVHNRVSDIDLVARDLTRLVPDARVAVAHGQMDEGTLETVVNDFWQHRYDVLVCTTIIESGIDMPSVNTLIVDRADLLGLGQLHQLRGRVGRGGARAYAYLFHPRDRVLSETAYERLRTIGDNTALGSGFKIAMRDLEIRGAGNLVGHDQSGPIAAVGYDLYVRLVAEAVAEAKGEPPKETVTVSIDLPGEAHLPVGYVEAEDLRLEAYRRLAGVTRLEDLEDVAAEWSDRFGPLPAPARNLITLAELRLECLRLGVRSVVVQPPRVGVRSSAVARLSPLRLPISQQMRLRRLHGARSYDESTGELRLELDPRAASASPLIELLRSLEPAQ